MSNTHQTAAEKLAQLRIEMTIAGVDAFLVPQTDEYLGEYIPDCAQRLAWLSGFTGSAGIGIILKNNACVMSDGRYTIQLAQQIDGDVFEAVNSQEITPKEWISSDANKDIIIGYYPKLHTPAFIEKLESEDLILKALHYNLIDSIWHDRPASPKGKVFLFDEKFAGQSAQDKVKLFQDFLAHEQCDGVLLTQSDSIAWLLNIRGRDLPYIPVVLSYLILPADGKAQWFVDALKITDEIKTALSEFVEFKNPTKMEDFFDTFKGQKICYDPKRSSIYFRNAFSKHGVDIIEGDDPVIHPRACKNNAEQAAMKNAHIRDGVAFVKFLKWFDKNKESETLDELAVEKKLESFRAMAGEYKEPSFNTISGYGANGAIVHYRADEASNKKIIKDSLLLLDSGAQYIDGTTDITRTIAVGQPSEEMIKCNTLVLKGHIALASAQFKQGTLGKELDELARGPLIAEGLNYSHGTGHGVGCYLSVHEEAASISPRGEEEMCAGMIVSNEPGYYKEGAFGIRIENLILCNENDASLYFETITLAPFDKKLIDLSMLSNDEKKWINDYHHEVWEKVSMALDDGEREWLKEATLPI